MTMKLTLASAAAGVGVTLVPASMQEMRLGGVRYLRLPRAGRLRAPLTLATRSDSDRPTVVNLLSLTQDVARRHRAAVRN
jgi:DNA-binding transcriptional LysR family regulator